MRDYPSLQYPARCRRTHRVCELQAGEFAILAGRLADRDALSDETGTVRLCFNTAYEVKTGDIVEVEGRLEDDVFHASVLRVLVPSRSTAASLSQSVRANLRKRARVIAGIRHFLMRRVLWRLKPL